MTLGRIGSIGRSRWAAMASSAVREGEQRLELPDGREGERPAHRRSARRAPRAARTRPPRSSRRRPACGGVWAGARARKNQASKRRRDHLRRDPAREEHQLLGRRPARSPPPRPARAPRRRGSPASPSPSSGSTRAAGEDPDAGHELGALGPLQQQHLERPLGVLAAAAQQHDRGGGTGLGGRRRGWAPRRARADARSSTHPTGAATDFVPPPVRVKVGAASAEGAFAAAPQPGAVGEPGEQDDQGERARGSRGR